MLIAHLSDLHARGEGAAARGLAEEDALERGLAALLRLNPQPELVIVSGDVADDGDLAGYSRAADFLNALGRPIVAVPGNHDDPEVFPAFLDAIGARGQRGAPSLCSLRDFAALRVIGLPSNLPLTSAGGLDDSVLDWLDETLAAGHGRPTLIVLHHPPFRCGIGFMDRIRLVEGAARFECIVAAHPQILAVLCGHHHRAMETSFGGRPCYVAPSLSYQVSLDWTPGGIGGVVSEPAAYRLLHWDGRRLVSHCAFVEDFPAMPFRIPALEPAEPGDLEPA